MFSGVLFLKEFSFSPKKSQKLLIFGVLGPPPYRMQLSLNFLGQLRVGGLKYHKLLETRHHNIPLLSKMGYIDQSPLYLNNIYLFDGASILPNLADEQLPFLIV